jgi:release factor glutamine methyltransferase
MIAALLAGAAGTLREAGVEQPRAEARLLLAHALGCTREALVAQNVTLDPAGLARFEALLARRITREPVAYILGRREFWSLDFAVGPGVLIPRPESELLVAEALRRTDAHAPFRAVDFGTGSGALLLSFLSERPEATGVGVDLSGEALAFARRNAETLGLAGRARFVQGDWAEAPMGPFDVALVNPPYIAEPDIAGLEPDVRLYEPHAALSGGADGLAAYRALAPLLRARLAPKGQAFIEIGQGQAESVAHIFVCAGMRVEEILSDLADIPRCLVAVSDARAAQTVK